jgi:hypothetical protein
VVLEQAIFEEELAASGRRVGGANPKRLAPAAGSSGEAVYDVKMNLLEAMRVAGALTDAEFDATKTAATAKRDEAAATMEQGGGDAAEEQLAVGDVLVQESMTNSFPAGVYAVEFAFVANKSPLRTMVTGKEAEFKVAMSDVLRRRALGERVVCPGCSGLLRHKRHPDFYEKCKSCKRTGRAIGGCEYRCPNSWSYGPCYRYFLCKGCHKGQRSERLRACADTATHATYLRCPAGTNLSLLLPSGAVLSRPEICARLQDAAKQLSTEWFGSKDLFDKAVGGPDGEPSTIAERLVSYVLGAAPPRKVFVESTAGNVGRWESWKSIPGAIDTSALFDSAGNHARLRWLAGSQTALADAVSAVLPSHEGPGGWQALDAGHRQKLAQYVRDELPAARGEQASALLTGSRGDVSFAVALEFRLPSLPQQGQRAALLRFAPPPIQPGRRAKRQEASVYVDEGGRLVTSKGLAPHSAARPAVQAFCEGLVQKLPESKHGSVEAMIDCVVFLEQLPTTSKDKSKKGEQLVAFLEEKVVRAKIFQAHESKIVRCEMPQDDGGVPLGMAFVEFETPEDAATALSTERHNIMEKGAVVLGKGSQRHKPDGLKLDKRHTLRACPLRDEIRSSRGVTPGRWHVLVASVTREFDSEGDGLTAACTSRTLALYVDGTLVSRGETETDDAAGGGLSLGARVLLLGGGKQSEARGGDVRKVRVIDGFVTAEEAKAISTAMLFENPLLRWAAVKIQASARRRIARTTLAKDQKCEVKELPGAKSLKRMAALARQSEQSDDY